MVRICGFISYLFFCALERHLAPIIYGLWSPVGDKPADHCTILAAPPSPENLQLGGGIFTVLKAVNGVLGLFLPLMFATLLRKHVGSARGCGRST